MTRLQAQWQRLYVPPSVPPATSGVVQGTQEGCLIDAEGGVKAMVLSLGKPADWAPLSAVWQGVQAGQVPKGARVHEAPITLLAVAGQRVRRSRTSRLHAMCVGR